MKIDTYRVKQYNSTSKTVVCIDGKPICIVKGCGKTLSNIISYIQGYDVKISDEKIKKIIDKYKEEHEDKWVNIAKDLISVIDAESIDENIIIEKANDMGLTFAKSFNGRPYALMDANWVGYFNTLEDVCDYLYIPINIKSDG